MRRLILLLTTALLAVTTAAPAQAKPPTRHPVIFVHGYDSSGDTWSTLVARFRAAGHPAARLSAWTYPTTQSLAISAAQLAEHVERVRKRTGAKRVDLVSHSMGSLVSRYYLRYLGGTKRVDDWASLAGANHGTRLAAFCAGFVSCREMLPGSSFLRALNQGDETPGGVDYRTWYSRCDALIRPYTSTLLDGAENTDAGCVSHSDFLRHRTIAAQLIKELQ